jgi:transcriptional regulator with XRE-family HTH domain
LLLNKKLIKRKGGKKLLDIQTSNSIVANRVKEIISKKGLKQASVAEKAGFTPQEFSDMLNGRRLMRAIDIASIINALAVVGVTANDLFSNYAAGKGGE